MSYRKLIHELMLPAAIITGISSYLIYHFCDGLRPIGPVCHEIASRGQTFLISIMLFLQYIRISPRELRFRKWHLWALLFQVLVFVGLTAAEVCIPEGPLRIILESALLCFICPTASAAGIITERLGGNLASTMAYVVIIYSVTTFLIPAAVPIIHPSTEAGFWLMVWRLIRKLFPMLILPGILAWAIRYLLPRLHGAIYRISHLSFYVWGVSLTLAMVLATRALLLSGAGAWLLGGIALVSALSCAVQYMVGQWIGKRFSQVQDRESAVITAGQALGQKNTGLLIWMGYSFMTPVTSIAGGLYAIFQNIFNSWEIYRRENKK